MLAEERNAQEDTDSDDNNIRLDDEIVDKEAPYLAKQGSLYEAKRKLIMQFLSSSAEREVDSDEESSLSKNPTWQQNLRASRFSDLGSGTDSRTESSIDKANETDEENVEMVLNSEADIITTNGNIIGELFENKDLQEISLEHEAFSRKKKLRLKKLKRFKKKKQSYMRTKNNLPN